MIIDNDIIESHFDCNYKSYLKLEGHQGKKHVFEKYQIAEFRNAKKRFLQKIFKNSNCSNKVTLELLKQEQSHIANAEIQYENLKLHCDLLKKVKIKSVLGDFAYVPILVIPSEKITKKVTTLITGLVYVLSKIQGMDIGYGEVFYVPKFKTSKVKTSKYLSHFHAVIDNILQKERVNFRLNSHCTVCEFSEACKEKAIKEDHLSLLKGMAPDTIRKLNNRGIFTTNQLSYTFRPKRKTKIKVRSSARSFALQALAIREKRIFVYDIPDPLPKGQTEMFLDIEGIPDDNFQYLIGLTIKTETKIDHINFWSNNCEDELGKASEFLSTVLSHEDFSIYHYGSYETDFLKKISRKLSPNYQDGISKILNRSVNILSILYSNVYFPTYTNGLKEIGKFIGFKRSEETITGLESIVLRRKWEASKQAYIKERLITYNKEDCLALLALKEVISSIIENNSVEAYQLKVCNVKDLQKYGKPSFIVNNSFLPEMKFINDCSYFDYQREKVYAKSNTDVKRPKLRQRQKKSIYTLKPNKIFSINAQLCENCKSRKLQIKTQLSRQITDLKFTISGVRRYVIRYRSSRYLCKKCKHIFIAKDYPIGRLHIGHNLISWAIFENIVNKQAFKKIANSCKELFHLSISYSTFHACKDYLVRYYESTYQTLITRIINSSVLYVDETPFSLQLEKGYVWVFTNGRDVISFYKPTRESSFLKDFLKEFRGVLVTDFYSGYDAIECPQQRCLIHLIRDLNSDLIRNPFNEEFKGMAKSFTKLLQMIVETIDKHGLKKYFLKKHVRHANKFLSTVLDTFYKTEIAQQYQSRVKRNRRKLFQFLNYDNISWNNTNAEHAIKILAMHANKDINAFRETRIDNYLKIMSIYQTCEYRSISFLKFLLSKERSIN